MSIIQSRHIWTLLLLLTVLFDGSYAKATAISSTTYDFAYFYYNKDHLGNNRVVTGGSTVYQRTHYYPFGGPYADVGTASDYQPYKYNGKELDRMHGLDLYDYGFRHYDPIVPMFTQQDPMAEKYYHLSPYVYCGGNPVNAIDLNGDTLTYVYNGVEYHYTANKSGFYDNQQNRLNRPSANAVSTALSVIQSGKDGAQLIDYLSSSSNNVEIRANNKYNMTSYNEGNVKVLWNPDDYEGAGLDIYGGTEIPPYVTLAHELYHARDYIKYGASNQVIWYSSPNGIVRMSEYETCINENKIRTEHDLPLRRYYSVYSNGKGFEPSLIPIFTKYPISKWGRNVLKW